MFDGPSQAFQQSLDTTHGLQTHGLGSIGSRPNATLAPVRHLTRRAAAANADADFKVLYETNLRVVRCALSRLGVREPDLKDMTQKVFLIAFMKLPDFEGRSMLSTWLWGICRRVAIAYRRSGVVRREVATDPFEFEVSLDHRAVMPGEPGSLRDVAVEHLLGKLSESQRLVFKLSEVDDLDGPQIATLLNVSLGTVRSRLRYARQRIRRELKRLTVANAFNKNVGGQRTAAPQSWNPIEFAS